MSRYIEAIYVDKNGNGYQTRVGAEWESDAKTTEAFESIRSRTADIKSAPFILDLHEENGDIVDSIAVTAQDYSRITGEPVLSEAEYIAIDDKYWADLSDELKAA